MGDGRLDLSDPVPIPDDEDRETLSAIDEGIRDTEAGDVVPAEEIPPLLVKWTTESSTREER